MDDFLGWVFFIFCRGSSRQRPPHPLSATSAPFLAVPEPGQCWGEPWGCRAPYTVNFLRTPPLPPRRQWLDIYLYIYTFCRGVARGLNYTVTPARHRSLEVLSVINSSVLNLTRRRRSWIRWVGQRAELRPTPKLIPVMAWHPTSLICVSTALSMMALHMSWQTSCPESL